MLRLFTREAVRRSRAFISVAILLALTFLASLTVISAPLTNVFVNGVRVDAYPVIHDGIAYLPIQVMAQAMEAEIIWDAKLGTVKVNGVNSPASVYNQNGKVLLPIESFITGLGGNVIYDGRNNMIRVETPEFIANGPSHSKSSPAGSKVSTAEKSSASPAVPASAPSSSLSSVPAGTTAALSARSSSPSPAFGSPVRTENPPAASANTGYGVYNKTSAPPAYGTPGSGSQTAYGAPAYGVPPGVSVNGSAVMPSQSSATVKPSFRPPYPNAQVPANQNAYTPGAMSSNSATLGGIAPNVGINPIPSLSQAGTSPYIPRTAQNSVFKVTVSNLEIVPVIKDFYKPRSGSKFVVASLSQQNISNQVQIYTGKFSLVDQNQNSYDHLEGLSNFWLVILRPYGVNFGYLVFEIPQNSKPICLVLHALNQAPLTINL